MKKHFYQLVVGVTLALTTQVALAYYIDVPGFQPSWRGLAHTTVQKWSFSATPTNGSGELEFYGPEVTVADVRSNPYGIPSASITAEQTGIGWVYGDASSSVRFSTTNYGWWDLGKNGGGSITLAIPNVAGPAGSIRYIWLQVTEAIFVTQFEPATIAVAGGTQVESTQTQMIEDYNPSGSTVDYVTVYQMVWEVPGNTSSDTITITGATTGGKDSVIGGIVVDTGRYPLINNVAYSRAKNLSWKIKVADLLTNALPSDHSFSLVSVSGASHGTASNSVDWVFYYPNQPDQNLTDTFTYVVSDNTMSVQDSGTVTLNVAPQQIAQVISITESSGQVTVYFAGIPGYSYEVQRSTDVNFTAPTLLQTITAPSDGLFSYTETPPSTPVFYRLKVP
jgi:hypothetical protein